MINRPDPNDIRSLKAFFRDNQGLSMGMLAQLSGIDYIKILKLRRKAEGRMWPINVLDKPEVKLNRALWDNADWFRQMYIDKQLSASKMSSIVGYSKTSIQNRLKKYNIPIRKNNTSFDRKWFEDHYQTMELTISECAELTGRSALWIYTRLVEYQIHIRDNSESTIGSRKFYGKQNKSFREYIQRRKKYIIQTAQKEELHTIIK